MDNFLVKENGKIILKAIEVNSGGGGGGGGAESFNPWITDQDLITALVSATYVKNKANVVVAEKPFILGTQYHDGVFWTYKVISAQGDILRVPDVTEITVGTQGRMVYNSGDVLYFYDNNEPVSLEYDVPQSGFKAVTIEANFRSQNNNDGTAVIVMNNVSVAVFANGYFSDVGNLESLPTNMIPYDWNPNDTKYMYGSVGVSKIKKNEETGYFYLLFSGLSNISEFSKIRLQPVIFNAESINITFHY